MAEGKPGVTVIEHKNFNEYPTSLLKLLEGAEGLFTFQATTKPGKFTQLFATVKGECEQPLIEMAHKIPAFKPYSLQPAFVDSVSDEAVKQATANRQLPLSYRVLGAFTPLIRNFIPSIVSPTQDIGLAATVLAMGDGKGLDGSGVSEGGRILSNEAIRRIAKDGFTSG
ncbi:nucleoside-diphosphate-sugar epimerase [Blastomyces dermatitidis ER-3]|uniref:Nucleoside-diphosphate-sugar epimerase n=2 Tax=Ajellomyces dermatitidis TaxID=5039 RepID=F2TE83_AJEDA|nr:nucleoside-diphosphate-sugar epimerase [Blastomyces dermatitidis ER-3]EEQ89130.2 nucleoside-diphosphate-sugar epimerase [Blastomyces dermatitidis ER-3]EGE81546.2 hypothetical protein BDDG_04489 [Blastomyces dermatitidis ATCC 18188]EQL31709.1 hypothetical protein BDFG_05939 [Blastomyces dermatitidis ATCC 26199]